MVPAIALALKLGGVVPSILSLFDSTSDKVATAEKVVSAAESIAGVSRQDEAKLLEVLSSNSTFVLELEKTVLSTELEVVKSVNQTMQVESKSEKWPQYSWRPSIGFSFAAYLTSLWILPLFNKVPVTLSSDLVLAIGGILGVTAWYRGRKQVGEKSLFQGIIGKGK